jgi:hypothetical protein
LHHVESYVCASDAGRINKNMLMSKL